MNKHIDLAKKLKALSEKGVGGEKINAEKMLNDLMKKHNLTIEDIEGENKFDYFLKLKKEEEKLFNQIVKRVNTEIPLYGEFPAKDIKAFKLKGNFLIKCTASEYVEIESMFIVYNRLYKDELNIFYRAFCTANDLLVTSKDARSVKDMTDDEYNDWLRATAMASKIKSETFRKQIN